MSCRNPECSKGLTPGLVMASPGSSKIPLIGSDGKMSRAASMRWGWVRCLACSPNEEDERKGVTYKHQERTPDEIAQRRANATNKSTYKPESAVAKNLGGLSVRGQATVIAPQLDNSAQLNKLLEQVTKLTEQITELLDENRQLRKRLDVKDKPDAA